MIFWDSWAFARGRLGRSRGLCLRKLRGRLDTIMLTMKSHFPPMRCAHVAFSAFALCCPDKLCEVSLNERFPQAAARESANIGREMRALAADLRLMEQDERAGVDDAERGDEPGPNEPPSADTVLRMVRFVSTCGCGESTTGPDAL